MESLDPSRMFCDWSPVPDKVIVCYRQITLIPEPFGFPSSLFDFLGGEVLCREIRMEPYGGHLNGVTAYRWYAWDEKTRTIYTTREFDSKWH